MQSIKVDRIAGCKLERLHANLHLQLPLQQVEQFHPRVIVRRGLLLRPGMKVRQVAGRTSDLWDEVMRRPSSDLSGVPKNLRSDR